VGLGRELLSGRDSLAVEAYRERLLSAFKIAPGKNRTALDLGCGDGLEAVYLARLGYKVEALDLEPHPRWKSIEKAWKGRVRFRLANATKLGGLKPGYDLVFEKDMLHHVEQPGSVLTQMKRLVKKGGRVLIAECNRYNPIFYVHLTLWGGHQHFSSARLKALLDAAGFQGRMIKMREARVWPLESERIQALMNRVQDMIEQAAVFNPWICYHLVSWTKPRG
jgi:2-polyprenyl-3-methyl-5-hydroxy-6-metoxy-1,4-benzoquinol methylase